MSIKARRKFAAAWLALGGIAIAGLWPQAVANAIPTTNSGPAYINECLNAGVPIPPDWGDSRWVSRGALTTPFISTTLNAQVYSYVPSTSPAGVCYALPRMNGSGVVKLLGIICQGNTTSRACFWDNSGAGGVQFDVPTINTFTPLSRFNGGAALNGAQGGTCTNCHAGENVFNIQPGTPLDLAAQGITVKPNSFVQPIVHASWPQNTSSNTVDGACGSCHSQSGVAGRFPRLSTEVSGHCDIMATAWNRGIMPPPGTPDTPDFRAHFLAMQQACLATAPPTPPPGLRQPTIRSGDAIALMWLATDT
jgi:hypothetical protein